MECFGAKLRLLRQQRNATQTDLARSLGLSSHAVLSNLEVGRKQPSMALIVALSVLLGTSIDYLVRDELPITPVVLSAEPLAELPPAQVALFGVTLQQLRIGRGLTQSELATALGLAANAHISFLENGKKEPSPALVVRIAEYFGVSCDYLLRGSSSSSAPDVSSSAG